MKKALLIVGMLALVCAVAFAAENLIKFGDMESGSTTSWMEEGSSLKYDKGKGIDGSTALLVKNTEDWSGVGLDVTKIIDRNKSYYIECWVKLYKAEKNPIKASITLEFRPDQLQGYGEDWESYGYVQTSIDLDYEERESTGNDIEVPADAFVKLSGVIRPEDMETLIDNHGVEITRPITGITCYFKIEPAKARRYWVDNVYIVEIPNVD